MIVRIEYRGIEGSPWMDRYMEGKLERLHRYLSPEAKIEVILGENFAGISIQNLRREYAFREEETDLYTGFSRALEDALRVLRIEHQKILHRIHRRSLRLE